MYWQLRLGKWRMYLSDVRMRRRQARDNITKAEKRDFWERVKGPLMVRKGGQCEWCGARKELQVHHVLPYDHFPQLEEHPDNLMLLCADCHRKLHRNPFLDGSLIRAKAIELNVDWKAVYGNPPLSE